MPRAIDPEVLLTHGDFVRAIARQLLADETRADDVVQATWLAALEHPPRDSTNVRGWLAAIARNVVRVASRGERRRRAREECVARRERLPSTADVVEREALRREVVEAVLSLDEPYRTTLLLRFFEDEPASAIAKRLGIPVETVRTRIKRGLDRVRERLDAGHDGDRRAWLLALVPLAKASSGPAASLAVTGAIVMKLTMKLLVAAVILLAILFAWRSFTPTREAATARVPPVGTQLAAATTPAATRSLASTPPAPRDDVSAKPHVSGVVVDRTGHPIVSASVDVYAGTVSESVALGGPSSVRTDDCGRFTIVLDGRAPFFSLVADAPGFSPERIPAVHANDDVTVTLDPARVLVGTVTNVDGDPIAGATIRWTSLLAASRIDRVAPSRADGTYRIEGLPSLGSRLRNGETTDIALIEVRAAGFAPLRHRPTFGLQPTSDDVRLDFTLVTGVTLTGRVVDGETSEPMSGARVVLWADGDAVITQSPDTLCIEAPSVTPLGETTSAADGSFALEHVPAKGLNEPPELRLLNGQLAVGWVSAVKSGWAAGTEGVVLAKDGESLDVTIRCWPKATISGRVVDDAGSPIVGAFIWPAFKEPSTGWFPDFVRDVPTRRVRTDERGRYALEAVAASRAGSQVGVAAVGEGFWGQPWRRNGAIDVGVRAGESVVAPDIVIAAEPSAIIEVRDANDRPVCGAKITADDAPYPLGRTDERGRAPVYFASEDPRCRGPQRVRVHAPGFGVGASDEFRPSAEVPPEVRVTLRPEHRLSGKITFDDGSSAAGVELEVSNPAVDPRDSVWQGHEERQSPLPPLFQYAVTLSRENGSFEVARLPEGPYRLKAWTARPPKEGFSIVPYEVVRENVFPDAAAIELKLVPRMPKEGLRRALEGTVRDATTDRPVRDFHAFLGDAAGTNYARTVPPATFRFEAPPAGTWTLHVRAEGYAWFERAGIEIAADQVPGPIDVALECGATVHGNVRGLSETDLSHSIIELHVDGEHEGPSSQVKRDGSYSVRGIGPGRYFPLVYDNRGNGPFEGGPPPWIPDGGRPLDVTPSTGDVALDPQFVRAGRLLIIVGRTSEPARPGAGGESTEGTRVLEIRDANAGLVREWRGALPGSPLRPDAPIFLLPGRYSIRLLLPGREPIEKHVGIDSGGTTAATFELP